jgi:transcriptional regulator with XRE-family HTH domain
VGALVGENVRRLREDRGWTRAELATRLRAIGLRWTHHQVTAIELGRREGIELSELVLLLDVFEVPARALLCSPHPGVTTEVQLTPDAAMFCEDIVGMLGRARFRRVDVHLSIEAGDTWLGLRADERLAERLGVGVGVVIAAAERLWGHSLTEERDRREADLGADTGDRRARRGHITRELSAELAREINNTKEDT